MRRVEWSMADLLLRLAGLAPITLAGLCGGVLRQRMLASSGGHGLADLALAAVIFVGASTGVALLIMGRHLFDPVPVARRWAPLDIGR